jgi:catechol 2,3-dioxygenase-like lactoylglutathione lyase family enzyme
MDWKIEVVPISVSDVDRARDFYAEKLGFNVDIDVVVGDGTRLVQLTPPGSACSIHLSPPGMGMETGSVDGVFLVVSDLRAARESLIERGVEVGDFQVFDEGAYRPAKEGESLDLVGCVFFDDPDGNRWCIQQIPARDDSDQQEADG